MSESGYTIHVRKLAHGRFAAEVSESGRPRGEHIAGFSAGTREEAVAAARAWVARRAIPTKRRGERETCEE